MHLAAAHVQMTGLEKHTTVIIHNEISYCKCTAK